MLQQSTSVSVPLIKFYIGSWREYKGVLLWFGAAVHMYIHIICSSYITSKYTPLLLMMLAALLTGCTAHKSYMKYAVILLLQLLLLVRHTQEKAEHISTTAPKHLPQGAAGLLTANRKQA